MSGEVGPTRAELELALRAAHLAIAELREDLHALAAQVVALTERVAPPERDDSGDAGASAADQLAARTAELRREIALAEVHAQSAGDRVLLGNVEDKYAVSEDAGDGGPPCAELLPICGARCCSFEVALSTQDLDEGLRWNYATPYLLERSADGMCGYHDGASCRTYATRPATCRRYDCRGDARVWSDYEGRVLAELAGVKSTQATQAGGSAGRAALEASAEAHQRAMFVEASRLRRKP